MKALLVRGRKVPAAICALANAAAPKLPSIPITSPVDFISGRARCRRGGTGHNHRFHEPVDELASALTDERRAVAPAVAALGGALAETDRSSTSHPPAHRAVRRGGPARRAAGPGELTAVAAPTEVTAVVLPRARPPRSRDPRQDLALVETDALRWTARAPSGLLLRAHGARRRRPHDARDARGDVRSAHRAHRSRRTTTRPR